MTDEDRKAFMQIASEELEAGMPDAGRESYRLCAEIVRTIAKELAKATEPVTISAVDVLELAAGLIEVAARQIDASIQSAARKSEPPP